MPNQIDDVGWPSGEIVSRARGEERVLRLRVNAARQLHGSSRVIGQVMQCGPPPPRTSSPPLKVIAALAFGGMSSFDARKSDALIIRKPAFSNSLSVVSLRA